MDYLEGQVNSSTVVVVAYHCLELFLPYSSITLHALLQRQLLLFYKLTDIAMDVFIIATKLTGITIPNGVGG